METIKCSYLSNVEKKRYGLYKLIRKDKKWCVISRSGMILDNNPKIGLLSGMIFEPINAVLLVSFSSTIGATFAFLLSRYLFADIVKKKYIKQYEMIDAGFKKYNNYYIFALRMCILFPFFLINIVLGLTSTRVLNFYLISQIGMLPATIIIVNIGNSFDEMLSSNMGLNIEIVILLTLLGLFPLIAKLFFKRIIN